MKKRRKPPAIDLEALARGLEQVTLKAARRAKRALGVKKSKR